MKLWRKDLSWGSADIFPLQFFPRSPIPPSFFTLLSFICPSLILSACLRFFSFFPLHHLLVLSVLRPSHRGFLWWPNYEIQQANWGCLKQGLLGRLAAAGKKQLGQGGPVLSFCLHTRTRKHRRASPSRQPLYLRLYLRFRPENANWRMAHGLLWHWTFGAETRAAYFHSSVRECARAFCGGLMVSIFVNRISQIHWSHLWWWHI